MMRKVLVAVTDSPASLAAARGAVELAACLHGEVRVLHAGRTCRRAGADRAGRGNVAARILAHARAWNADVVVIVHTPRRGIGEPFIGVDAQRVLEFGDRPVLVVPSGCDS